MFRMLSLIAVSSFAVGVLSGIPAHSSPEDNLLYRAVVKLIVKYEELEERISRLEKIIDYKLRAGNKREEDEVSLREYGVVKVWLRFRSKPSFEGRTLFTLRPNEEVEILEDLGEWVKVRTKEGYVGYVYSAYVVRKR